MPQVQTILHPTDFSEGAQAAFQLACSLARDLGARLVILHVAPTPLAYENSAALVYGGEVGRNQPPQESGTEVLKEKLRKFAVPDPPAPVEYEVALGEPAQEILAFSRKINAGLIVMGTHGRTGLSRLLMGSVAEQVVRAAHCPVLTAKAPFVETVDSRQLRTEEAAAVS